MTERNEGMIGKREGGRKSIRKKEGWEMRERGLGSLKQRGRRKSK